MGFVDVQENAACADGLHIFATCYLHDVSHKTPHR